MVNNDGILDASSIRTDGGKVLLVAAGGSTSNSGTVTVAGVYGGRVQLLADQNVSVTGQVDAAGTQGGGSIRVGGGLHGGENLQRAAVTYVGTDAKLSADATQSGDGGSVVVWSDKATGFMGQISAKGGANRGHGGDAEISSQGYLELKGHADLRADHGNWGTLLLDPGNITISSGADAGNSFGVGGNYTESGADADSNINVATILTQLNSSNVNITAASNITVAANTTLDYIGSDNRTLALNAGGAITFDNNAIIQATGTGTLGGNLNGATGVVFNTGSGFLTNGGNIAINASAGNVQLNTLNTGVGTLNVTAVGDITQTGGLSVGGASSFSAANHQIQLSNASNHFVGPVSLSNTENQNASLNNGNNALTLGTVNVGGHLNVSAGSSSILLTNSVTTGGDQSYIGAVALGANTALSGTNVSLLGGVTGNHHSLGINGNATLGMVADVSSLLVSGTTSLNGDVSSTGNQTFADAVTLANDITLTSDTGKVTFVGTVDNATSAKTLDIHAQNGAVTFVSAVGGNGALEGLTTNSKSFSSGGSSNTTFLNVGNSGLHVTTAAGDINQGGAFAVTGDSSFTASNGAAVNLNNTNNALTGDVSVTGNGIRISSATTLNIATLNNSPNSEVRLISGGALNLASGAIDTGSEMLVLAANGGTLTTTADLTGAIISLAGSEGLTINNKVNATYGLSLSSSGGEINEGANGSIITPTVSINSLGDTTLLNPANKIDTLNGVVASDFSLVNNSNLNISNTILSKTAMIQTLAGNIALNGNISASGFGDAIVLASGGKFTNNVGSSALNSSAGRWLVWSQDPAVDSVDGLAKNFIQYNAKYGSSPVLGTGNGLLYELAPFIEVSLTGATTKTYDGNTSAILNDINYMIDGSVNGDTVTINKPTTGNYISKNVPNVGVTKQLVMSNGAAITSATNGNAIVYGYQLLSPIASGMIGLITPAELTLSGLSGTDRPYDGTKIVMLAGTAVLNGLVNNENLSLNNSKIGTLASADAGSQSVTVNVTLTNGTGPNAGIASNYHLSAQPTLANVNITPVALTVTGISGTDRAYNGSTLNLLSGTGVLHGLVNNENLVINNTTTGTLASANVGSQAISTAFVLSDGSNGFSRNYTITQPTLANVNITPAQLIVTGLGGVDRVYDGTTIAGLKGTATLFGLVNGETLTMGNTGTGTLTSANAGSQGVTTAVTLGDGTGLASNYNLIQAALPNVNITPAPLTLSGLTGTDRVYNGTTIDALTGTAILNGLVAGETLTLGNTSTGILASPNAGSQAVMTAVTLADGSGLASNYTLTQAILPHVNITPAPLTVTGLSGTDRAYNGSTINLLSGTGVLNGLVNGETLVLNNTSTGTLASANVGTQAITTTLNLSNGTGLASNYTVTQPSLTANITPAQLVVTGLSGTDRVYDGTTVDALKGTATLFGLVNGETLTLNNTTTGTLTSPNAGSQGVTTAITLSDGTGLASNYNLIQTVLPNVIISPASLTITADNAQKNEGTPNPPFGAHTSGFVGGESLANLTGNLSLTTNATQTSTAGKYNITPSGLSSGNYTIQYVDGILTIVPSTQSPGYVGTVASTLLPYPENSSKTPATALEGLNLLSVEGTGISLPEAARSF